MSSENAKRILIVLLGSIGDVIRGLALARELKQQGNFLITWLVEPKSADVVRICPDVDDVIVFERSQGLRGAIQAIRQIRKSKYFAVLDLQRHFKSGIFSFASGATRRIGFNSANTKEFNHWFNTEHIGTWNSDAAAAPVSKLHAYLSFLSKLGLTIPTEPRWSFDEGRLLTERPNPEFKGPAIGLVLGSSWESKDWMGNEALCRELLRETKLPIVLLGDKKSKSLAQELVQLDRARILSTAGELSLAGLASIVRRCAVVIGPDSGPGHLAAALSIPYIGIFGPTDPRLTAPYGSEELALASNLGCAPCYRRICPGLGKLCMRLITPKHVLNQLKQIAPGI